MQSVKKHQHLVIFSTAINIYNCMQVIMYFLLTLGGLNG